MKKTGLFIALIYLAACANSHTETGDLVHEHGDEARQTTLYTEHIEFFVEYDPLVVGEKAEFLVHLTRLESYKPVLQGRLTVILGDQAVASSKPDRPGIYQLVLSPDHPGEQHLTFRFESDSLNQTIVSHANVEDGHAHAESNDAHVHPDGSVHGNDAHTEAKDEHSDHDEGDGHDQHAASEGDNFDDDHANEHEAASGHIHASAAMVQGELSFLKEQAWKADFMVREVLPREFSAMIYASGELLPMPGESSLVTATQSGIVSFRGKQLLKGQELISGEELLVLSTSTMVDNSMEQRYKELKNSLEESRSVYNRHKELVATKVISESRFFESRASYTEDSIRFYSLARSFSKDGVLIHAPFKAYVHELFVSEGQYVEAGEALLSISTNRKLILRADVSQRDFSLLKNIRTANFRTAYSPKVYSISKLNGKLSARGNSVAENSHFLPVYFELENDGSLLEGAFAEVYLHSRAIDNVLTVPVSAILEEQGANYLYVQLSGESFTKRAVKLGENDGIRVVVLDGLTAGTRIVTEGAMLLKAASTVSADMGHGHSH